MRRVAKNEKKSNWDVRFEFEWNLEASQVRSMYCKHTNEETRNRLLASKTVSGKCMLIAQKLFVRAVVHFNRP